MVNFKIHVDVDTAKILKERGLTEAQQQFTKRVKEESDDYVPFLDGDLRATVTLSDKQITYSATHRGYTYAAKQYYGNAGRGKDGTSTGGLRGKDWAYRMWKDRGSQITKEIADMIGGKVG